MNKKDLRIPSNHKLIQTKMENKVKKSEDYDLYYYDEFDAESNLVSKYIVKHTTSIYPPFSVYVEYQKFDVDGNLIEEKRVWDEWKISSRIYDKWNTWKRICISRIFSTRYSRKFGEEYVYENENGNLAISRKVLNEFKKLKDVNGIEWDRSDRCWVKN